MPIEPEPLSRLLYISTVASDYPETAAELAERICDAAVKRNRQAGLTGCLLQVDDKFIQVIEGPIPALEETFERICCDLRHNCVKLIDHAPITQRLFGGWDMACLSEANANSHNCSIPLREELSQLRTVAALDAPSTLREMRTLLDRFPDGKAVT